MKNCNTQVVNQLFAMKKTTIILILTILVLAAGAFYFLNKKTPDEAQEELVLEQTVSISKEYLSLRLQTDNVLINAESYPDYESWNTEMTKIIDDWENLAKKSEELEKSALETANLSEEISFNFIQKANAYTAKEISDIYDKAPKFKGIATLAKHLGVDAKRAQMILDQAQAEITSGVFTEEGDAFENLEHTAIVVKDGCKVAGFVGGVVLTGGAAGFAAAGTLTQVTVVVAGADLALEVTEDSAQIAFGDKNKVSSFVKDVRTVTEPVASVLSITNIPSNLGTTFGKIDAVMIGLEQFREAAQEGKVVGVDLTTFESHRSFQVIRNTKYPGTVTVAEMEMAEVEEWLKSLNKKQEPMTPEEIKEFLSVSTADQTAVPKEKTEQKEKFKIDGEWVGTITYTNFTPAPETLGDDNYCQSSSGLPVTAPLKIQVTGYSDNTVYNAVVDMAGGAYCEIYPDGWDNFSSSWKKNTSDGFTMIGGGPIKLTNKAVSINLPTGYSFIGYVSEDGKTISGEATQTSLSFGGGTTSYSWFVSKN